MRAAAGVLHGAASMLALMALFAGTILAMLLVALPLRLLLYPLLPKEKRHHPLGANVLITFLGLGLRLILTLPMRRGHWDTAELRKVEGQCILVSNHRSWIDGLVLYAHTVHHLPPFRFLIKKQLLWIPLLGLGFWAVRFPALERESHRHTHQGGGKKAGGSGAGLADAERIRRSYSGLRGVPSTLAIFPEGTRLKPQKHAVQPTYRNLLPAKSGGLGIMLETAPEAECLYDITLCQPSVDDPLYTPTLWRFLCLAEPPMQVRTQRRELPQELRGADYSRPETRAALREWVAQIWREKDEWIEQQRAAHGKTLS